MEKILISLTIILFSCGKPKICNNDCSDLEYEYYKQMDNTKNYELIYNQTNSNSDKARFDKSRYKMDSIKSNLDDCKNCK
jgi:hypothetical protein